VRLSALGAAAISGGALFVVYLATLAPTVTLWDSGEFLAAAHALGVPHPPGTPLFIFGARAWATLAGVFPFAVAVNAGSAAAAAAGAGAFAWLLSRWTGRAPAGVAGALIGGTMAAVWQSATETEVYAYATLAVALALVAAEVAGTRASPRHRRVVAFIFGLAVPLHISVLVAGPAIVLLSALDEAGRWSLRAMLAPAGAWALAAGVGTVAMAPMVVGSALLVAAAATDGGAGRAASARHAALSGALALLGASFVVVMLVRASHDPFVNEGDATRWQSLVDIVARRQFDVPPLWPRRAPPWLQVGNLVQYADWQVAAALSDAPGPSPLRTPVTLLCAALGIVGARWHLARDRRSWTVLAVLALCASLGVVVVLNLRAGPSFGWGILPTGAVREARERDYFFALAFLVAGLWMGCGVAALRERWRGRGGRVVWLLAGLPLLFNWGAVDRKALPDAQLARELALALLHGAPRDAVLVVAGDNDTFPLWYLQEVEGVRRDVTTVTVPLLGADWYRAQLRRRDGLVEAPVAARWRGLGATLRSVGDEAARAGRPLLAAVSVDAAHRAGLDPAAGWRLRGMSYHREEGALAIDASATDSVARALPLGQPRALSIDSASVAESARFIADTLMSSRTRRSARDPAGRYVQRLLGCPALAWGRVRERGGEGARAGSRASRGLLESTCNFR